MRGDQRFIWLFALLSYSRVGVVSIGEITRFDISLVTMHLLQQVGVFGLQALGLNDGWSLEFFFVPIADHLVCILQCPGTAFCVNIKYAGDCGDCGVVLLCAINFLAYKDLLCCHLGIPGVRTSMLSYHHVRCCLIWLIWIRFVNMIITRLLSNIILRRVYYWMFYGIIYLVIISVAVLLLLLLLHLVSDVEVVAGHFCHLEDLFALSLQLVIR